MARTESQMAELGASAPAFDLPAVNPSVNGQERDTRSLSDFDDAEALVIVFMCNHCPYVKHIEDALLQAAREYESRGVRFVGICSNNAETHPEDSFESLAQRARDKGYPFPYLRDESQEVAQAYGAVCTPDFFVYDRSRNLAYRGRFDESRPNQGRATGRDLRHALDELLASGSVNTKQHPSIGCNIKWKSGNAPA